MDITIIDYAPLIDARMNYNKEIQEKLAKVGSDAIISFIANSYGVSNESVIIYRKRNDNRYPLLYTQNDTEKKIVNELKEIDRFLKLKKLRHVQ